MRRYSVNQRRVHYVDISGEPIKLDSAEELQEAIKALNETNRTIELQEMKKEITESNKDERRMAHIKKMKVESKISKQKSTPKRKCMNTEAEAKENNQNSANVDSAEDVDKMEFEYRLLDLENKPLENKN
ncbi:hypothetical protein WR25_04034 [Diploscapter pachys]|uniref:Uncharacterized protein n=1 Tax=Diploscapter pachys TaxID=2018661 RepID=A0A2A2KLW9_9BILA|nr:hypothetical protein WR25_04034 [Diploscapter pachys]